MIKIKLNRDELQCLCWLTNPIYIEVKITEAIRLQNFTYLNDCFSLIEIGTKASKKFLFDHKKNYKISLTYAQAAAFWNYTEWHGLSEYQEFVLNTIKATIINDLTNYQNQYYGKS